MEREPLKPNWKTYIAVKMATSDGVKLDAGVVELKRAEGLILILDTPKGGFSLVKLKFLWCLRIICRSRRIQIGRAHV